MSAALTAEVEIGTEVPTALYRLFGADGALLYVGVTDDLKMRLVKHATGKTWWPDVARKTVTWYKSRNEALFAEAEAIYAEHPRHNIRQPPAGPITGACWCSESRRFPAVVELASALLERLNDASATHRLTAAMSVRDGGEALHRAMKVMTGT